MLCKYSYMTFENKQVGKYQCDVDEFKKLLKYADRFIRCAYVELQDGKIYIAYRKFGRLVWECVKGNRRAQQLKLEF